MLRHVRDGENSAFDGAPAFLPPSAERAAAETLIERLYARCYGARLSAHYPNLISVHASDGSALAAAGVRDASDGGLFLESYLTEPVEAALARLGAGDVPRHAIVEIGNLASRSRPASIRLFHRVAEHLEHMEYRYAVVTATRGLRGLIRDLGLATFEIAPALPERLPDRGRSWGRYYDAEPVVIAGQIACNAAQIAALFAQP
ncbi:MAG: thermostable hemolysin [Alphaproteobacteria bacterium]|nr:thermostable hemolysin [Alphaproteobacteria bacterium]